MNNEQSSSSAPQLILYWAVVGIPLAWGVYKTCLTIKLLFT